MGSLLSRPCERPAMWCAAAFVALAGPLATAGYVPPGGVQAAADGAVDAAQDARHRVRIEGTVLLPGGGPAGGAVVISSAGGQAAVEEDGSFALEVALATEALAVELTAVASGSSGTLTAHQRLGDLRHGSARHAGTLVLAQSEGCVPDWIPTFGASPGMNDMVLALAVFDDGSGTGPALYAGGTFNKAGAADANLIAKWDGQSWSALGSGLQPTHSNEAVLALTVFDDGSGAGPALYAAGHFDSAGGLPASHIAKWDGQSWSALGSGFSAPAISLAVFDDGSGAGPALYVGGNLGTAGGLPVNHIARWDGQSWSTLGSGVSAGYVNALIVFDDGSGAGPALYAGGGFTSAGGQSANRIARWDGQSWSALGSGVNSSVNALTVFDDGSGAGPALYAGGLFTSAGGQSAGRIARWDGQAWSALSSGLNWPVHALAVFDDGSGAGPALFAGGEFTTAGGLSASLIARWDGQGWSALGSGMGGFVYPQINVQALAVFDDGSGAGPALVAGGAFITAGGLGANRIARWDGQGWSALGSGLNDAVRSLVVFDDGSGGGPALYAGGGFASAGGEDANCIAKWDGQGWSALSSGMSGTIADAVLAMTVFDDGSGAGPALYAGGDFTSAGGQFASGIARWDGQGWSALSSGMNSAVNALTVFDDGSGAGPALYAGGHFTSAGGQGVGRIAKWDGQSWSALSSGMNGPVLALAVFDDGSGAGPALYAGGFFTNAGGQGANYIARWDGQSWSVPAGGMNSHVAALTVFDDGSGAGPALYAGGLFTSAGGQSANRIARWDGQAWSALSSGMNAQVRALTVADDGSGAGPTLYAGGDFTSAGGQSATRIARWDGQSWSALSSGMSSEVDALIVFDDGSGAGSALYAGGTFHDSPGGDSHLAKWACPVVDSAPGCFGNPAALVSLSSAATIGDTFSVRLSASGFATGVGLLFFGLDGTDAAGCGLFVPGIGELLLALAPNPVQVGSGLLHAGAVAFTLPVPDAPSLVGLEVAFHGVAVGFFDPGVPIELSNALVVTITQ